MTKPYPTIAEVHERIHSQGKYPSARAIVETACDLDRERREVAEVERIDWAAYPGVLWVVKFPNGHVHGKCMDGLTPSIISEGWREASNKGWWVSIFGATIPGPWQDSLRTRPEGV